MIISKKTCAPQTLTSIKKKTSEIAETVWAFCTHDSFLFYELGQAAVVAIAAASYRVSDWKLPAQTHFSDLQYLKTRD